MCTLFSASHLRLYNVSASVSFVIIQTVHLRVILYSQFDGIDLSIKYRSYCAIPPITLVNARNIITATRKKNFVYGSRRENTESHISSGEERGRFFRVGGYFIKRGNLFETNANQP